MNPIAKAVKDAINCHVTHADDTIWACGSTWKAFIEDPILRKACYINQYVGTVNWNGLEHETVMVIMRGLE